MENKKRIILFSFIMAIIVSLFVLVRCSSFSKFKSSGTGTGNISVADFGIKLNGSSNLTQNINLKSTITTNSYSDNYLMPGTNGNIVLTLDFSNVDVSANYTINIGTLDLPTNLKLYSDSSYTTEFSSITGTYNVGSTTLYTHNIYWKWDYKTDDVSTINDNLYMNKSLSVPVVVIASQKIGGGN